jgi:hypothetical protein
MKDMHIPPDKSFGRTMAVIFFLIAAYFYYSREVILIPLIIIGGAFLFLSQFFPKWLHPLNYLWTLFGFTMGKITNPIMLTLVYSLMIFPISLILKLTGRDLLNLKFKKELDTYWIEKKNTRDLKESMKVQF